MSEGSNGRRRFSDKWGKHELDVLAVLSSAFPQWLTSRQIAQRVKAYADSYGELADQAAKAAFAKQFQRDRAKLSAMGIAIESRQPEYSSKSDGQDFASYRLQLGDESRIRIQFTEDELPILAAANYIAQGIAERTMGPDAAAKKTDTPTAHGPLKRRGERRSAKAHQQPYATHLPAPGLGLDSIAPGLGTQAIPKRLTDVIDSRRFEASVETDEELINVVYTDSDDLAMFVLAHPGARIKSPKEAADAFRRRLLAASNLELTDLSRAHTPVPAAEYYKKPEEESDGAEAEKPAKGHSSRGSNQTGSEVDRRLRLLLFLSAHIGGEYTLQELADQFIGPKKTEEERRKALATIRKDVDTLTTVSDDGEIAGSQFFDIDWSLLEDEGLVSATNSLGLERLAGISPQYLSLLTASANYLAHSALLPPADRAKADALNAKLRTHTLPGTVPWLSLTGYELDPPALPIIQEAIKAGDQLDLEYTDGVGRTRQRFVTPVKIFVDEGIYYLVAWNGETGDGNRNGNAFTQSAAQAAPQTSTQVSSQAQAQEASHSGIHREWSTLKVSRIGTCSPVHPDKPLHIPDVPLDQLRQWNFDNGTEAAFTTDTPDLPYIANLPSATVEPCGQGVKVHLTVTSDTWFMQFCIAHARHITAVAPEPLRSLVLARAKRELSIAG